MAPTKRKKKLSFVPRGRRAVVKRRVVRNKPVSKVPGIGGLLAKGVRTITSYLPGQSIIKPIVDFGLKAFGIATITHDNGTHIDAVVKSLGVGSNFALCLKDVIFSDSQLGVRTNGSYGRHNLMSNFSDGKLLHLHIRAERSDPRQSGVGRWGVAFLPYRNEADISFYKDKNQIPGFRDLDDIPGAVIGSARMIDLNFRVKISRDGRLAMPLPLTAAIGSVLIAFENVNRNSARDVGPDEFGCVVTITGAVLLSRPQPFCGWTEYDDKVQDYLESVDRTLIRDGISYTVCDGQMTVENGSMHFKGSRVVNKTTNGSPAIMDF